MIASDILKKAAAVYYRLGRGSVADESTIANAILSERERCAGIAEMHEHQCVIAAAIRKGEP